MSTPILPQNGPERPTHSWRLPPVVQAASAILLILAVVVLVLWQRSHPHVSVDPTVQTVAEEPSVSQPAPEVSQKPKSSVKPATRQDQAANDARPAVPVTSSNTPRLALIIDDWGHNWSAATTLLELPIPLTVAVLPHLPLSEEHARRANEAGFDVLVHLPMEPEGRQWERTAGMVTTSMGDDEVRVVVARALQSVPHAIGVNNHMGSLATADRRVMGVVLAEIATAGLIFVDSRTSPNSQGEAMAKAMGIPTLASSSFIDHERETQYVKRCVLQAAQRAHRNGYAVAIGHVDSATARGIQAALPEIAQLGVRLVRVSELFAPEEEPAPPVEDSPSESTETVTPQQIEPSAVEPSLEAEHPPLDQTSEEQNTSSYFL